MGEGGSEIRAVNGRHHLTEAFPICQSYVPNDVNLGRVDYARALIIRGPNSGVKYSYALITALSIKNSKMGCYVPSDSVEHLPFDSFHARMGASDCMAKGMCSFMV